MKRASDADALEAVDKQHADQQQRAGDPQIPELGA